MPKDWTASLKNSTEVIKRAEPIIRKLLKCDQIMVVEGKDDDVCKQLDLQCGIDYLETHYKTGLTRGIASRVQWVPKEFHSITIRKERESGTPTEFAKRKYAIEHNGQYPYLTMQIYVHNETGQILFVAIAKTTDVIQYIDDGHAGTDHTGPTQKGQSSFYVVWTKDFQEKGYKVITYTPSESQL